MGAYFEYYKVFYHVTRCGSITGAAEKLSLTQPSVTRAIKSLESQLGLTLFTRSKQGVALTPEGQHLYDRIAPACEQFFAAEEELAQIRDMERGLVRVGIDSAVIRSNYFLGLLKAFREQHPRVRIKLEHSKLSFQQDLQTGNLDCCFLSGHADFPLVPGLMRHTLYSYDDVIVVGKNYAAFAGRELTNRDLALLPAVNFDIEGYSVFLPGMPSTPDGEHAPASIDASTLDFQIQLVKAGFGYTFVPRLCVEAELQNGELFALQLKDCPLKRTVELIVPGTRPLSHAAQKFTQLFIANAAAELT